MFEGITIGDRIKLEHIKSKSFIDSVVVDFDEAAGESNWIELPGSVTVYARDGWERVS